MSDYCYGISSQFLVLHFQAVQVFGMIFFPFHVVLLLQLKINDDLGKVQLLCITIYKLITMRINIDDITATAPHSHAFGRYS